MATKINDLWLGAAKDFIKKYGPKTWGKDEQVAVTYQAIKDGVLAELTARDEKHILAILSAGENTSACAQILRGLGLIPQSERKTTSLTNRYVQIAEDEPA